MFRLIRTLFWVAVGAAGALEAEKWMDKTRQRFRPSAVTGSILDRLNQRLESNHTAR